MSEQLIYVKFMKQWAQLHIPQTLTKDLYVKILDHFKFLKCP
jgi:hypothetical protein